MATVIDAYDVPDFVSIDNIEFVDGIDGIPLNDFLALVDSNKAPQIPEGQGCPLVRVWCYDSTINARMSDYEIITIQENMHYFYKSPIHGLIRVMYADEHYCRGKGWYWIA